MSDTAKAPNTRGRIPNLSHSTLLLGGLAYLGLLCNPAVATPPTNSLWQPVPELSDEFDGTQVDASKWHSYDPTWKGNKPGYFIPGNVAVSNNQLHLTMRYEDPPPEAPAAYSNYTCAAFKSKEWVQYGYFEIRAKPMDSIGNSAFWFYDSTPEIWTEIDVFEIGAAVAGLEKTVYMSTHAFHTPTVTNHIQSSKTVILDSNTADSYRTYGLEWLPSRIRWYIDGELVRSTTNTYWHQPLYINLNTATMPDWFGLPAESDLPQTFTIDYFRAWEQVDSPINLISPTDEALFPSGLPITLAAAIAPTVAVDRVEFLLDSTTLLGTDTDGTDGWQMVWDNAPLGKSLLSARVFDTTGSSETSPVFSVQVSKPSTTPSIAVLNPSFEDDLLADGERITSGAANWIIGGYSPDNSGALNPSSNQVDADTVDGTNVAYIRAWNNLTQALGTNFVAGNTYTLSFTVARITGHTGLVGQWRVELQSLNGSIWETEASLTGFLNANTGYPENGNLVHKSFEYTADATANGREIRIGLIGNTSSSAEFYYDDIRLDMATPSGYHDFEQFYGIAGDPDSGFTNDYDGDGQPNAAEYGLGGNPTNPANMGIKPRFSYGEDDQVRFQNVVLTDPNADITYIVEQTTNLVSAAWINSGWNLVSTNATADPSLDEVEHRISGEDEDQLFMRLRITQP